MVAEILAMEAMILPTLPIVLLPLLPILKITCQETGRAHGTKYKTTKTMQQALDMMVL